MKHYIHTKTNSVFVSMFLDYLNLVCNTTKYVETGRRLESSTKLYYEPNVACYYTVNVEAGKKVMLLVR